MNVLTAVNSTEGFHISGVRELHIQAKRNTGQVTIEVDRGLGFQAEFIFTEDKTEILKVKDCNVRFIITADAQVGWS